MKPNVRFFRHGGICRPMNLFNNLGRSTAPRPGSTQVPIKDAPEVLRPTHRRDEYRPAIPQRVAVGMTIADHPPHRSVLAELPHTAPPLDTSVEALIGIGMKSTRARNPSIKDRPQLFPIGLPPLTTTT